MSSWSPDVYERFRAERAQPGRDLIALCAARPGMSVVDLGCGTGELTRELHDRLEACTMLGIDASAAMLARAESRATPTLAFRQERIEDFGPRQPLDLIFSNAALHWVSDHASLFSRLSAFLAPSGQLAVQMPANDEHPAHVLARRLAGEVPFAAAVGEPRRSPVWAPERYATQLESLGFREQHVRLAVYGHRLARALDVVEWLKGTLFTFYAERLAEPAYADFVHRYAERLGDALGCDPAAPYFFTYNRILLWARR